MMTREKLATAASWALVGIITPMTFVAIMVSPMPPVLMLVIFGLWALTVWGLSGRTRDDG